MGNDYIYPEDDLVCVSPHGIPGAEKPGAGWVASARGQSKPYPKYLPAVLLVFLPSIGN